MDQKQSPQPQQSNQQQGPVVQINSQYAKDLSFEAPNLPFILTELKTAPKVTVGIDVKAGKTQVKDAYTVELNISVNAQKADDNKTLFLCELTYGAHVSLNVPTDQVEPILLVEIPHLLFPYARAIVANTIREGGMPALQINPVDFAYLYREKLKNSQSKKN